MNNLDWLINFRPGEAGGAGLLIVLLWIVAGVIGIAYRIRLLLKWRKYLRAAEDANAQDDILGVGRRHIASSWMHIFVKLLVIAIGVNAAFVESHRVNPTPPALIAALAILLIPLILSWDSYQEVRYLRRLDAYRAPPPQDSTPHS